MRELRSCDFCGGDAAGTFAIVPPELEPTEAEQRRVVLCPDCEERLETLIEPLLARAGAGDAASVDGEREAESDAGNGKETRAGSESESGSESGDVVASADASTRKRSRTSGPNATASDGNAATDSESAADPELESESGPVSEPESDSRSDSASPASGGDGGDESTDATGGPAETALEDGITFGADEGADDRSADTDGRAASGGSAAEKSARPSESAGSSANDAATRPPNAYGKVIRLLRNREFPMQRSAVEELAAGAYDLEPDEADAIVDYAIEQGEFVEKRGTLTRP